MLFNGVFTTLPVKDHPGKVGLINWISIRQVDTSNYLDQAFLHCANAKRDGVKLSTSSRIAPPGIDPYTVVIHVNGRFFPAKHYPFSG